MQTIQSRLRTSRTFVRPRLQSWSIRQAENVEVTGSARADYERELRISAIGVLLCSTAATQLWRRVCRAEMYREIRERSDGQRVAMEIALQECAR